MKRGRKNKPRYNAEGVPELQLVTQFACGRWQGRADPEVWGELRQPIETAPWTELQGRRRLQFNW